MEVLHPRCAGIDVHRDSVVACARVVHGGGIERFVETFGTTTAELERLARWLAGHRVTHAAMEATGVYWKPVWAVLAEGVALVLAEAMHVRNVTGRKRRTGDMSDAMPADIFVGVDTYRASAESCCSASADLEDDMNDPPCKAAST